MAVIVKVNGTGISELPVSFNGSQHYYLPGLVVKFFLYNIKLFIVGKNS